MGKLVVHGKQVEYDYDEVQDMLYIRFEPIHDATFYEDVVGMKGVMLRHAVTDEHLVGITAHEVRKRLPGEVLSDEAIHHLAERLIQQLQAELS